MENEQLMQTSELAAMLAVPVTTIYRWNHLGTGPRPIKIGKHVRFSPSEVQVWLDRQKGQAK